MEASKTVAQGYWSAKNHGGSDSSQCGRDYDADVIEAALTLLNVSMFSMDRSTIDPGETSWAPALAQLGGAEADLIFIIAVSAHILALFNGKDESAVAALLLEQKRGWSTIPGRAKAVSDSVPPQILAFAETRSTRNTVLVLLYAPNLAAWDYAGAVFLDAWMERSLYNKYYMDIISRTRRIETPRRSTRSAERTSSVERPMGGASIRARSAERGTRQAGHLVGGVKRAASLSPDRRAKSLSLLE